MRPTIIQRITTGWNIMRLLRLVLTAVILYSGITNKDPLLLIGGSFLLLQTLLNIGCASGNCAIDTYNKPKDNGAVVYEKIKNPENL